jgi:hypothetical protein
MTRDGAGAALNHLEVLARIAGPSSPGALTEFHRQVARLTSLPGATPLLREKLVRAECAVSDLLIARSQCKVEIGASSDVPMLMDQVLRHITDARRDLASESHEHTLSRN